MGEYLPIGERLREQRERLGMNQTDFAADAGVSRKTLFGYETGERAPDAAALAAWAKRGLDVQYVVTGLKSEGATHSAAGDASWEIDAKRLARIVDMLEAAARAAGRKWPARELVSVAVEVYNALGHERELDEPKVERILKLVVNR